MLTHLFHRYWLILICIRIFCLTYVFMSYLLLDTKAFEIHILKQNFLGFLVLGSSLQTLGIFFVFVGILCRLNWILMNYCKIFSLNPFYLLGCLLQSYLDLLISNFKYFQESHLNFILHFFYDRLLVQKFQIFLQLILKYLLINLFLF